MNIMKTLELLKLTMFCALGAFAVTSCDDDDDKNNVRVPDVVQAAFGQQYAGVGHVEWDAERGGYLVAEFMKDGKEHEAWYTAGGQWMMTEVDYGRSLQALPRSVQDGYAATSYARQQWAIDDIDEIQRPDYDIFYKIEVEKTGQPDYDLYFDLNGTLFREVRDNGGNNNDGLLPVEIPAEIQSFISTRYAGAVIVDFEKEVYGYEADVRHDGKSMEIRFGEDCSWLQTATDVSWNIPELVVSAVNAGYPGKRIEDCDYVETYAGELYYLVDLDGYDNDIKVTPDGKIAEIPD